VTRPQPSTLVAGLALALVGVVLELDARGDLALGVGALAPIACAVIGAILLAGGLSRRP
jgi:hypothetical protein